MLFNKGICMDSINSALTLKSSNKKTGEIVVSTTSRSSCPTTCPLIGENGCYNEAGFHTRLHWDYITAGKRGLPELQFIEAVSKLKAGSLFRHNIGGDLWHQGGEIRSDLLQKLAAATRHLKAAWTYTHHLRSKPNLRAIKMATNMGFTINLSTEVKSEAASFAKKGYPVVCVVPEDAPAKFEVDGVVFRQCPATFNGSPTQCKTCGGGTPLCARGDRQFVVTFPVHGGHAKEAAKACG
jgi:hypothetical protein